MTHATDPSLLRGAENDLFVKWKETFDPDCAFLPDGAMPDFARQNFRVVFVLKEGNDPDGTWVRGYGDLPAGDLRDGWKFGYERGATWRRIASWAGLILDGLGAEEARTLSAERTAAVLRRICFLNLKKKPGGAVAVSKEIQRFAAQDESFIREQISLYEPNLIVCCGLDVFLTLQRVYSLPDSVRFGFPDEDGGDTWFYVLPSGTPVMDFWHPQTRSMSAETLYRRLTTNLRFLRDRGLALPT